MKKTLNIDNTVRQRLREEAVRRGTTMPALVEAGLRRILHEYSPYATKPDSLPPLPSWRGDAMVDISNREDLYLAMGSDEINRQ